MFHVAHILLGENKCSKKVAGENDEREKLSLQKETPRLTWGPVNPERSGNWDTKVYQEVGVKDEEKDYSK